jgi:hypothetical protein
VYYFFLLILLHARLTVFWPDVVFGTTVAPGVGDQTIDIPGLKANGDKLVFMLQEALGL